ncbi:hypothetical protein ACTI_39110 [Actinoplanes sp. OR16]|uniref:hypothetical protein n=1 Tax=Actinoplanes sp. OR16 TaxID=946334 RepID=UPI000F6D1FF4|nr:hypothetical protein [Actinoplanes sp. OR16]BBH67226.1 hypothetical protein ACTI_39110 [Actinoplanes sp. OR16]
MENSTVPVRYVGRLAPDRAADLAVRLQALFGQHAVLAADLMRSRIRGDDDFVQAANAALSRNTDAMTELMARLFGADVVSEFRPLWTEHLVELVAYAGAVAGRDDTARREVRAELVEYEGELSAYLAGPAGGRLDRATVHHALAAHVDHLTAQADAYAAGDWTTADRIYRDGYRHLYDVGFVLADGLLATSDRPALREPVWRLRSQLGRILAEHVVLVEHVTRAAVGDTPDFDAAASMINANTRDLVAAMAALFGTRTARDFQEIWGDHVESLVAYAGALARGDEGARARARHNLAGYEEKLSSFLSDATGDRLTAHRLATAFAGHDGMLLRHADAFAARDFPTAHDIAYTAYEHEFELAREMADAFGATVAARLPRGGAQTGLGGCALPAGGPVCGAQARAGGCASPARGPVCGG